MKLLEILTSPYLLRCECAACFTGTYLTMTESVNGMESDAITILANESLYNQLKLGNQKVDMHSRTRFAILLSLVSNPNRKMMFIKNFIKDKNFDLDLLSISSIREFNKRPYSNYKNKQRPKKYVMLPKLDRYIKNAVVFRRFPELMENKILPYETQKIIFYLIEIYQLGPQYFQAYFKDYLKDDLILITHVLFDQYSTTKDRQLVRLIQDVYAMIETSATYRFKTIYPHSIIELTNKILSQSNHEYLPFKTPNFGAKNWDEYLNLVEQTNLVKDKFQNIKNSYNQKVNGITTTIKKHRSTIQSIEQEIQKLENQLAHNNLSERRLRYLQSICDLNPLNRLKTIILSDRSIHYFPEFMFEDSQEYIEQLTQKEKAKLLSKLKTVKRGILKELMLNLSSK